MESLPDEKDTAPEAHRYIKSESTEAHQNDRLPPEKVKKQANAKQKAYGFITKRQGRRCGRTISAATSFITLAHYRSASDLLADPGRADDQAVPGAVPAAGEPGLRERSLRAEAERAGQPQEGALLGRDDLVGQLLGRRRPHRAKVDRVGHRRATPIASASPAAATVPVDRSRLADVLEQPRRDARRLPAPSTGYPQPVYRPIVSPGRASVSSAPGRPR